MDKQHETSDESRSLADVHDLTLVKDIYAKAEDWAGKEVKIGGTVRTIRAQKALAFISLSDGSCFTPLQIVVEAATYPNFEEISQLGTGTTLICRGTLVATPTLAQPIELHATEILVEGASPSTYPLQAKRHSREYLRTIAHLRPRANLFQAVFRLRSEVAFAIHRYFHDRNFVYVHTPILTTTDAEGAGEMFHVTNFDLANVPKTEDGGVDYSKDFFGRATHLTVTGQLEGESFAQAFRDIYTFGPTFRAEDSNTPRHAAEFWMIEPEMAFCELDGCMEVAEGMVKAIFDAALDHLPAEMAFFDQFVEKGLLERLQKIREADFARMTYTDAIEVLKKAHQSFQYPVEWGIDLQTEHERYLSEVYAKRPIFITDYPKDFKAFYMKQNADGKTVRAVDLLVPGVGEIIGGSQREEDYDKLARRIEELKMPMDHYTWYLDLRKYGTMRHAGYGLGFERMIMYLSGVNNIRDVLPYPRTTGQIF